MKIAIDARFLGPQGKGLGRYVEKLIKYLAVTGARHEYFVLLSDDNWQEWQPPHANWHKVRAPWRWYSASEQLYLPRLLRSLNVDLVHFPHFNVPVLYTKPFIVTIHDLILSQFPTERVSTLEPVYFWLKHRAYQFVIRTAVRRAKRVLTVSQYSKDQIIKEFKVAADKVTVTYEAVDSGKPANIIGIKRVTNRHGINKPYLLYVGNAYPHKNLERLLEAFTTIKKRGYELQLVLVGKMDYFYQRIQKYAQAVGLRSNQDVIFTGYVSDEDLGPLYAGALAYIFPSKAEGFGLPPLEAMQYGTPVVSSRASCLPEVLGDAALYFDPTSTDDIIRNVSELIANNDLRQQLSQRGLKQIKKYSWSRLAQETLVVYESVIQS